VNSVDLLIKYIKERNSTGIVQWFLDKNPPEDQAIQLTVDILNKLAMHEDDLFKFRVFFLIVKGLQSLEEDVRSGRYSDDDLQDIEEYFDGDETVH